MFSNNVRIFELCQSRPIGWGGRMSMADRPRVWLVTGVSTERAGAVLQRGDTVVGTLRRPEQCRDFEALAPGRAHGRVLDVTDAAAIGPLVEGVVQEFGCIDVLVNNAGYGLFGAVEELSDAEGRRVMETNFFGLLNLTRAVLPQMRARRSGHVINISSVAGLTGMAGVGLYCASKFAVTGLSESLAQELAPFGIRVTVVEPGGFRTEFSGGSLNLAAGLMPEYADTPAARTRGMREHFHGTEKGDPRKAANAVVALVDSSQPPVHLLLGSDALSMARHKLDSFQAELSAWESVTVGTSFTQ
jgi:NAD(P)-dependent dehydrogenase (short-subunit alcohol dehydrogenase family)